jgi:FixJ family two-component response regulator
MMVRITCARFWVDDQADRGTVSRLSPPYHNHRRCILSGVVHVVDDDASFRTAIERRLKKAGFKVSTYPSAQHLLDCLPDENGSGCILLDVRIPGLSGPELQGRLGELGSTLPIVFLTGYADVPTTVQTIKAGADDFLTKPVSSEQLLGAIRRAIAHREAARDERGPARRRSRASRVADAARTRGFRTRRSRQDKQAYRP